MKYMETFHGVAMSSPLFPGPQKLKLQKADILATIVPFGIGLLMCIPVGFYTLDPWNSTIMSAVPNEVGVFFFLFPVWMLYSTESKERYKESEIEKVKKRYSSLTQEKDLISRVTYAKTKKGLLWEVLNQNSYSWNNVYFIISLKNKEGKHEELHRFSKVPVGQSLRLQSDLVLKLPEDSLEYYIVSEEGSYRDFPHKANSSVYSWGKEKV